VQGSACLIDDKLFRGARGSAGEIAGTCQSGATRLRRSHLPAAHSSSRWAHSPSWIDIPRAPGWSRGPPRLRDIFRPPRARRRSGGGRSSTRTARWVALAVVTLQSLLDLELIVFGGSIGVRPELYERVRRAPSRPLLTTPLPSHPAGLGGSRGAHRAPRGAAGAGPASEP